MSEALRKAVQAIAESVGHDENRLIDVVREVQARFGSVSDEAIESISKELGTSKVRVEGVVTFYSFLSKEDKGVIPIRLSECPSCSGGRRKEVEEALKNELNVDFGRTTSDRRFSLSHTACIGLCDQGPAAMAGSMLVARLAPEQIPDFIRTLRAHPLTDSLFSAGSAFERHAPTDNVRKSGDVIFSDFVGLNREPGNAAESGKGLRNAIAMPPADVIAQMRKSKLRGRGGAGFPVSMKWEFARKAAGKDRVIICNADEGEPGTFKDRAILNLVPELVIEGLVIAAYAIGAREGILYLRGEYDGYLKAKLENALETMRKRNLLGKRICGKDGFDFDIRAQIGAGAYICGEESALISSCEGLRGEPKNRPPFPVEKGYLGRPTSVNNVETFCCAARIMEKGAEWFASLGTPESTGTKLLSVSGDCAKPGIYEIPFGITLKALLDEVGCENAQAVLVGGPSGQFVDPANFDRRIGFEGLQVSCGSIMIFGPKRDLLYEIEGFLRFFADESCGYCVPCRVGNVLLLKKIEEIRAGKGTPADLEYLEKLCVSVKKMSRCGLGQSSPNPVHTTLSHFRHIYTAKIGDGSKNWQPTFDLGAAVAEAVVAQGREPISENEYGEEPAEVVHG